MNAFATKHNCGAKSLLPVAQTSRRTLDVPRRSLTTQPPVSEGPQSEAGGTLHGPDVDRPPFYHFTIYAIFIFVLIRPAIRAELGCGGLAQATIHVRRDSACQVQDTTTAVALLFCAQITDSGSRSRSPDRVEMQLAAEQPHNEWRRGMRSKQWKPALIYASRCP
ncbi:predicted protein [Histoplasma capsulatum H143]|uniref:Uncharacterized protein n=1 Tax=Ajellomyces capsulatus (strain H143) TaxID=544712 RepID=C6HSJ3_AJECH|nr:predicted protein [Histoplasma capsulatum H143]